MTIDRPHVTETAGVTVTCVGVTVYDVIAAPVPADLEGGTLTIVDQAYVAEGGCAFNCADALAAAGVSTRLIAAIGSDPMGSFLRDSAVRRGIDTIWVETSDLPTSTSAILVADDGGRTIVHCPGANAALTYDSITGHVEGDILYVGGALLLPGLDGEPLARLLQDAQKAGMTTVLDVGNDSSGRWSRILPALEFADVFTPNAQEAAAITGVDDPAEAAAELRRLGVRCAMVTRGASGAWMDADGDVGPVAPYPVETVDETGSGDAYVAGVILGLVHGRTWRESAQLAAVTGALASTERGGCGGHVTFDQISTRAGLGATKLKEHQC